MTTFFPLDRRAARPFGLAALMASTMLAGVPCVAAAAESATSAAAAGGSTEIAEVIVTASKREENLQKVPMSIQAIGEAKLSQLNVNEFSDLLKYLPSVNVQTLGPNQSTIFMRGISSGGTEIHSGSLPTVGVYLDEQPVTTIGGTLDVHNYDMSRVEVLPGPQGTLYGASSETGTLRLITNKPTTSGFSAGYDLQGDYVDHGSVGGVAEGFANIPLTPDAAVRLVGFYEYDPGFIDNVFGTRPFKTAGTTIDNSSLVANNFNHVQTYGGRAELLVDLGKGWTIEPDVIGQVSDAPGWNAYEPSVGFLKVQRFLPDLNNDKWILGSLTVHGKIGRYDLTYSGGYFSRYNNTQTDYTDYSVAYDQCCGYGASWVDSNGVPLANPQQLIIGRDYYGKESNEIRIASPGSDRFRFLFGAFQERQTHWIVQDYVIKDFSPALSVSGWPGTIWLTDQFRADTDQALFTEMSYNVTPQFTVTGGVRVYHYDNSLFGFYGFSANFSSHTGEVNCIAGLSFRDAPCVDLDKSVSAWGETHKINLTYNIDPNALVYFTYSTGYRPGGINRSGAFPPYQADTLNNFEVGWKTSWLDNSLHFNGALYDEDWNQFQFSFLGPNSLTIIENAPEGQVLGFEYQVDWRATQRLTLSSAGSYNHAVLVSNFCGTDQTTGMIIPTCTDAFAAANGAVHGQQLPFSPTFKGNVTARYTYPFMGWNGFVQASATYQSGAPVALLTSESTDLGQMPGFATADFSIGAQRNNLTLEIYLKNAFDTHGQLSRFTPCTTSVCAATYPGIPTAIYVVPIQPLTLGIKVGQRF
jgi:iron complex outermembrane recepter protein